MRKVVAFEGKPTQDQRYIKNGALVPSYIEIDVTLRSAQTNFQVMSIGRAAGFQRDEETGAISFDIITDEEYELDGTDTSIYLSHYAHVDEGSLVVEKGTIYMIHFEDNSSVYKSLKEER